MTASYTNDADKALDEIVKEYGIKVIRNCQVCGKDGFIWPCQYCCSGFCEDHADQDKHQCTAQSDR